MNLWQLKNLTTNESIGEPQPLPINWGPIFGLHGFIDKLNDLSWTNDPDLLDKGWFDTGVPVPEAQKEDMATIIWEQAKEQLAKSDWAVLPDVPMISEEKIAWLEYRKALREIRLQPGFPNDVIWPAKPE